MAEGRHPTFNDAAEWACSAFVWSLCQLVCSCGSASQTSDHAASHQSRGPTDNWGLVQIV
jgi:hypothetical protein